MRAFPHPLRALACLLLLGGALTLPATPASADPATAAAASGAVIRYIPVAVELTRVPDVFGTEAHYKNGEISQEERVHAHVKTGAQSAGGATGGIAGAYAGAQVGAAIGAFFGPAGAAVGGAVGGFAGAVAGGLAGERVAGEVVDAVHGNG